VLCGELLCGELHFLIVYRLKELVGTFIPHSIGQASLPRASSLFFWVEFATGTVTDHPVDKDQDSAIGPRLLLAA
jgi:hypothetical protein